MSNTYTLLLKQKLNEDHKCDANYATKQNRHLKTITATNAPLTLCKAGGKNDEMHPMQQTVFRIRKQPRTPSKRQMLR